MKNARPPILLAVALATSVLSACQESTAPEAVDDDLLPEAASLAAEGVVGDVRLMVGPLHLLAGPILSHGGGPGGPDGPPGGKKGGPEGPGGPISITRTVTFFDEAGAEQDSYDPVSTASLSAVVEMTREADGSHTDGGMERSREMVVTGLLGQEETRTFNGTGQEEVTRVRTDEEGTRSFEMTGSFTIVDVVVPVPGSEPAWPRSGTVERDMTIRVTGGPGGDRTRTVEVTVTFDGDQTATAFVDGERFEIDLAAEPGRDPIHGGFGKGPGG